jgi:hypothetical protein
VSAHAAAHADGYHYQAAVCHLTCADEHFNVSTAAEHLQLAVEHTRAHLRANRDWREVEVDAQAFFLLGFLHSNGYLPGGPKVGVALYREIATFAERANAHGWLGLEASMALGYRYMHGYGGSVPQSARCETSIPDTCRGVGVQY